MKFSKSLIDNKNMRSNLFKESICKSRQLISQIFGLKFDGSDGNMIEIVENEKELIYKVKFNVGERVITALLEYDNEEDDILTETLKIQEIAEETIGLKNISGNFSYDDGVKASMELLEEKYYINFIPFNLDERDENIKYVKENKEEGTWETAFNSDDHEFIEFKAMYRHNDEAKPSMIIIQNRKHIIYLD